MTMESFRTFSVLFCVEVLTLAYLICPSESTFTLTSDQNLDGSWTFTEGEDVTLKCTISPYTGTLKWIYASSESMTCGVSSCLQKKTGDGAFSFVYDLTTGVFQWSISPMKKQYDNTVFECNDGSSSKTFTAKVISKAADNTRGIAIPALVIGCLAITSFFFIGLLCKKMNTLGSQIKAKEDRIVLLERRLKTEF